MKKRAPLPPEPLATRRAAAVAAVSHSQSHLLAHTGRYRHTLRMAELLGNHMLQQQAHCTRYEGPAAHNPTRRVVAGDSGPTHPPTYLRPGGSLAFPRKTERKERNACAFSCHGMFLLSVHLRRPGCSRHALFSRTLGEGQHQESNSRVFRTPRTTPGKKLIEELKTANLASPTATRCASVQRARQQHETLPPSSLLTH